MASEEEFDTQVATGFTIVDFTAAWCNILVYFISFLSAFLLKLH